MESIRHPRVKVTRVYTQIGSGRKRDTMKITVKYALTLAGRRASLLAGGNGKTEQLLHLEATPALIGEANIAYDGVPSIDVTNVIGWAFDPKTGELQRERYYSSAICVELDAPATTWDEIATARDAAVEKARQKEAAQVPKRLADAAAREAERLADEQRQARIASRQTQTAESFVAGDATIVERAGKLMQHDQLWFDIGLLPVELQARITRELDRRLAAELCADEAWITLHGSSRLQKAVAAGLLCECAGLLRDERLAVDRPGWRWGNAADDTDEIRNPSESAIDALLNAREDFPHAELLRLGTEVDGDDDRGSVIEWATVIVDEYAGTRIVKAIEA